MRDDWQNWRDDHYPWYGGWYWGFAPGYWGSWDYLWDEYPVAAAVGLTWWGANRLGYVFGCDDYYNPYYSESYAVNDSEPVVTEPIVPTEGEQPAAPAPPAQENLDQFDAARAAFYQGKYEDALNLVDEAAVKLPHDAVLREFRSLVLFALGRYKESAAAIHAVLAVGPGWDWKTLSSLYPNVDTYTKQLRELEAYCKAEPMAADARFVLGYQYLTCGYTDQALAEFRRVTELVPNDTVSTSLVRSLSPRDATTQPSAKAQAAAAPKPIPVDQVIGSWTAAGEGTAEYSMQLRDDGTFTWSFSRGSRKESVKGVYAVEGNVLAMEPDSGGTMLAELSVTQPGSLHFQMVGATAGDPGLNFSRSKQ
jgi:tetratricopeptide (TPR) repeat protein